LVSLIAAALFFVLIHLLVSGTRVRDVLAARIGAGPYLGLFSLASILGLVWLAMAFGGARNGAYNDVLWGMSSVTQAVQAVLQLAATLFVVIGLATPNPTSVRQEGALDRIDVVRGMLRVTRHPFLWGVALWAIGHLLVNGDAASLILFGSMLVLAIFGTASIDAKRRRALGGKWEVFAAQTSNIPFAAVASGRQRLSLVEIGWWRIVLGLVVYAALAWGHPYLFGAPAFS
jgi:uncharacterized membrane protein